MGWGVTSIPWYLWKSKLTLQDLVLSFYHLCSRDRAQVLSLDSKHPYLNSYKPDIYINTIHQSFEFPQLPLYTLLCMFCEG